MKLGLLHIPLEKSSKNGTVLYCRDNKWTMVFCKVLLPPVQTIRVGMHHRLSEPSPDITSLKVWKRVVLWGRPTVVSFRKRDFVFSLRVMEEFSNFYWFNAAAETDCCFRAQKEHRQGELSSGASEIDLETVKARAALQWFLLFMFLKLPGTVGCSNLTIAICIRPHNSFSLILLFLVGIYCRWRETSASNFPFRELQ